MERIRCIWLEPTTLLRRYLRRFAHSEFARTGGGRCDASGYSYHNAEAHIDDVEDPDNTQSSGDLWPHTDPRWPTACACGYVFTEADQWQLNCDRLYRKTDTGEVMTLREAPIGAMWNATWHNDHPAYTGPDGMSLTVRTPGGDWMVDSRASNCDSPCANCGVPYKDHNYDACARYMDARPHKCWIRHGQAPNITVDKVGITCGAGAGSIQTGDYHGFLRGGVLERC